MVSRAPVVEPGLCSVLDFFLARRVSKDNAVVVLALPTRCSICHREAHYNSGRSHCRDLTEAVHAC